MAKEKIRQMSVKPGPETLAKAAKAAAKRGLPPVHLWNPPFHGDIDMRIAADGTWFYQGTPINRPAMVRLFSTILRRDGEKFFLVTPVEKVGIIVDDAPFIAQDFTLDGTGTDQLVSFTTNVGDTVAASETNPITLRPQPQSGTPRPYVEVRNGLEALVDRKSYYRLVDLCEEHEGNIGLWSGGRFFAFGPADGA